MPAVTQAHNIGLGKDPPKPRKVVAVAMSKAGEIRAEVVKPDVKAFRVYDTASADKPSHASVFLTKETRAEWSEKRVRRRLAELFIKVEGYRSGIDDVKPGQAA
jgi:hypothetical protein